MKTYNIQTAKTHLSRFVDQAAAGQTILIAKRGKPMARLVAYSPKQEPRPLGGMEKQITISPDFDEEDIHVTHLFTAADS